MLLFMMRIYLTNHRGSPDIALFGLLDADYAPIEQPQQPIIGADWSGFHGLGFVRHTLVHSGSASSVCTSWCLNETPHVVTHLIRRGAAILREPPGKRTHQSSSVKLRQYGHRHCRAIS